MKIDGAILAARYAYMPNQLRYCGGDRNSELLSYIGTNRVDQGLNNLLVEFETMYPYLKLIAEANNIIDPFDYRVVEAYWIGNELLETVSARGIYEHMVDGQRMKAKFKNKILEKVFGKIPLGAKPHHSWHVFNIPRANREYYPAEYLNTLNQCRIVPAKIVEISSDKLKVVYEPLVVKNDIIIIGSKIRERIYFDKNIYFDLKVGSWVAVHWGWVCDVLTDSQVKNLKKWTDYNLTLANIK